MAPGMADAAAPDTRLDELVAFYRDAIGLPEIGGFRDHAGYDGVFLDVPGTGAFDAGGASTVANCGIPDLRAASTETARQKSPVTFGAYSLATNEIAV